MTKGFGKGRRIQKGNVRVWGHRSGMGVGGGQRKRVGLLELLGT